VDHANEEHLNHWIVSARYRRHPFDGLYLHAEDNKYLEGHLTQHAGFFQDYGTPGSTIVAGARGSGKTVNCIKLGETLREVPGNFVFIYNASSAMRLTSDGSEVTLKHHLHEIVRLGIRQLLRAKADLIPSEIERELWKLGTWCNEFHPKADYQRRLSHLIHMVFGVGYNNVYVLIDERQTSRREPAKTSELLAPLLDESLFNLENVYIKLFVPNELTEDIRHLAQEVGDQVKVAYIRWSKGDLAELLRALLHDAGRPDLYIPRAEQLARLARTIPDLDQQLVDAVALNAPLPRELLRLGQMLFSQCASRWEESDPVSILNKDWTNTLKKWHHSLAVERSVKRPATLVPLRIEFTSHEATYAEVHLIEPDSVPHHLVPLPYEMDDLWAVLWALERFVLDDLRLPIDIPHEASLRKLGLVQDDMDGAPGPVLVGDLLERVGDRLYEHLFRKSGLDHLLDERASEVGRLRDEGIEDVRLWLDLRFTRDSADLARLPWELLRKDGLFLLQTDAYALTRYQIVEDDHRPLLRLTEPFSLLYVAPRVGRDRLSYDLPRIQHAFISRSRLDWREVEPPTFERLRQEARASTYQSFHFDGHGTFGTASAASKKILPPWVDDASLASTPQGYLLFEDGNEQADRQSASDVLHALHSLGSPRLQLALINACKSSTQTADPAFGGVVPALLRAGIPAVVGMLTAIEDKAAGAFVSGFYEIIGAALARQHLFWDQEVVRVLLQAMCEGRERILGGKDVTQRSWWIPTLNLHYKPGGEHEQRN